MTPQDAQDALAAATHADCEADWSRRPPGTIVTMHTVEAHREASERRVAALATPQAGSGGLDEERLARALGVCADVWDEAEWDLPGEKEKFAAAIAAAYAKDEQEEDRG